MEYLLQPSPRLRTSQKTFSFGIRSEWTPVFTFANPGDLAVASYAVQRGQFVRYGEQIFCMMLIWIGAGRMTHSTATGGVRITGLPRTVSNKTWIQSEGALAFEGITKAGYTQFTLSPQADTTFCTITASGSGANLTFVAAGDVPSAGSVIIRGSFWYETSQVS
jgi:hypothetical protein